MEREVARYIVRAAFRSAGELTDLLQFLHEQLPAEEYATFASGIGYALATLGQEVTNHALAAAPGLQAEINASIEKYGRLVL